VPKADALGSRSGNESPARPKGGEGSRIGPAVGDGGADSGWGLWRSGRRVNPVGLRCA